MANYLEMKVLFNDSGLKNRCEAAVIKAATVLLATDTSIEGRALAKQVHNEKERYAQLAVYSLVVANEDKTVDEIKALADDEIQAVVDASAPLLKGL